MLSVVASLCRGRSSKSTTLEPGLSANFKEREPKGKANPPAPPANLIPPRRKILKSKNLQVVRFIDNAWHRATIKDGNYLFLKGEEYTVVYNEVGYQETRVFDEYMRLPA